MKNFRNVLKISLLSLCLGGTLLTSCKKDDADTVAPTISLNGSSIVYVQKGQPYTDAGAVGSDNVDGSISVTSTGTVNNAVLATYTITYSGKDKAGNAAADQKRIVYVVDLHNVLFDVHEIVNSNDTAASGAYDYTAITTTSNNVYNRLTILGFANIVPAANFDCTWSGDKITLNGTFNITGATATVTGTGTISGSTADKLALTYKIVWTGGLTSTDNGVATYTRH